MKGKGGRSTNRPLSCTRSEYGSVSSLVRATRALRMTLSGYWVNWVNSTAVSSRGSENHRGDDRSTAKEGGHLNNFSCSVCLPSSGWCPGRLTAPLRPLSLSRIRPSIKPILKREREKLGEKANDFATRFCWSSAESNQSQIASTSSVWIRAPGLLRTQPQVPFSSN